MNITTKQVHKNKKNRGAILEEKLASGSSYLVVWDKDSRLKCSHLFLSDVCILSAIVSTS